MLLKLTHGLPAVLAAVPLSACGGIFKVDNVGNDLVVTDGRNRATRIAATGLRASNGVIHVIDKVILPAP